MKAIILVAGRGERMHPLTEDTPKCLLDIGGMSILEHQLFNLSLNGIKEVVVVTGFRSDKIEQAVAEMYVGDIQVKFIYNPFYEVSNNLFSLSMALGEMTEDFMIVNGDDVFHPEIVKRLLDARGQEIVLMINRKAEYDSDDMKVRLVKNRVVEVNKMIDGNAADGESIGIMKFTGAGIEKFHHMVFKMANGSEGKKDWYLKAVQNVAEEFGNVGFASVDQLPWGEIDFPEDLEYVRTVVMQEIEQTTMRVA